ncbi:MAG: ABC transporter permease [Cytophagales bacterium]|nr:ABC transporter permease [Cytophagales bacterium]
MRQSFYLAYRYISYHSIRSLVLIVSIGLIVYLPVGLKKLISESEAQMLRRARSTPLVVGAKGSPTDLVINALYFQQEQKDHITMEVVETVNDTGFGDAIPISSMFSARNFPIVGTDPGYFQFRKLSIESGRWMSFVGECVIGSAVAANLNIGEGDSLVSSPENFFDLAGVYPLKMLVVGVLNQSDSPDDRAVFVDIKTNWVIMGLGHGHEDLAENYDPAIVLERDSNIVKAGAKLYMYNAINGDNLDRFHFHGDIKSYPLSSMIFIPKDHKSETIFRGRFESGVFPQQAVVPEEVVNHLLQGIFRIKQVFNTVFVLVGLATALILALIVALSVRLRKNEIYTMFTIGSSQLKVFEIIAFELIILAASSVVFASLLYSITGLFVDDFIHNFII